jgi:ribonuclease HII
MKILGLDEAGRGSVIGPLVVGGTMMDSDQENFLNELGVDDSKVLSRETRETLYDQIQTEFVIDVRSLEPDELEENLTQVELRCLAKIINKLQPDQIVLDAPVGPPAIPGFVMQLERMLNYKPAIIAENKADAKYPIVAAASIMAKVTRDRAMLKLHEQFGDIGWGYPGEPKTIEFLKKCVDNGGFPPCVRQRWATVQRLKQRSLFD